MLKSLAFRLAALALISLQAACVSAPDPDAASARQVYVVRHLQKAAGDDPPLSAEGAANAERLAKMLSASGIRGIFATATRRARETAEPLALRLNLPIRAYDPRNPDALVREAAAVPGSVLVVGHSNTVPDLVQRFGGTAPAPLTEADYGTVWIIKPGEAATRTVSIGPASAR